MKVKYVTGNGRLTFEFEAESDRKLFEHLAHIQEVFEEPQCGCCKSQRIRHEVREFDGNSYYKLYCDDCGATLDFGQHKQGGSLFPKRHDKDRHDLPNRGWYVYGEATTQKPVPQAAPSANQVTRPVEAKSPQRKTPTQAPMPVTEAHRRLLDAFAKVSTRKLLDEWAAWGKRNFRFTAHQEDDLSDAYHAALERIERVGAAA